MKEMWSDGAVMREIGERLRQERLNQNTSQASLASAAGLSRKTITNLENGEGGTLASLVAVLRGLGRLENLDAFLPDPGLSPIQVAEMKGNERQRATGKRKKKVSYSGKKNSPWKWGDDT